MESNLCTHAYVREPTGAWKAGGRRCVALLLSPVELTCKSVHVELVSLAQDMQTDEGILTRSFGNAYFSLSSHSSDRVCFSGSIKEDFSRRDTPTDNIVSGTREREAPHPTRARQSLL